MCKILSNLANLQIYRRFRISSKNIFFMFHIFTINFLVPLRSVFSFFRPHMAGKLIFLVPLRCEILIFENLANLQIYRRSRIVLKNIFFTFWTILINFLVPLRSVFWIIRPQMAGKLTFCLPILRNHRLWVKYTVFVG